MTHTQREAARDMFLWTSQVCLGSASQNSLLTCCSLAGEWVDRAHSRSTSNPLCISGTPEHTMDETGDPRLTGSVLALCNCDKIPETTYHRRKASFWLMVPEVPVHGLLALLSLKQRGTYIMAASMVTRKQRVG